MSIEEIVKNERAYFKTGATRSYAFRMKQLNLLEEAIKKNEKKLMDALHKDLNKSPYESYITEIGIVLEEIKYHKKHLRSWMKAKCVSHKLSHFPAVGYRIHEP
ncbi:MAG: aldehyde dehydrogenase family protein, partial [Lachnospiraceae bacterium]|nr:aldehyde dehydrogenase family protein [Lachnospiraceae bacterium]